MAIHVTCPGCGRPYGFDESFAGRAMQCQSCGSQFTVPPPGVQHLSPAEASAMTHVKVISILNIVSGVIATGWAVLMIIEAVAFAVGAIPTEPDAPPTAVLVSICLLAGLGAAVAGGVLLIAGIKSLGRKPGSRTLTLWAGILNCAGLFWGLCCMGFLTVPVGIYTLIMVANPNVKRVLP